MTHIDIPHVRHSVQEATNIRYPQLLTDSTVSPKKLCPVWIFRVLCQQWELEKDPGQQSMREAKTAQEFQRSLISLKIIRVARMKLANERLSWTVAAVWSQMSSVQPLLGSQMLKLSPQWSIHRCEGGFCTRLELHFARPTSRWMAPSIRGWVHSLMILKSLTQLDLKYWAGSPRRVHDLVSGSESFAALSLCHPDFPPLESTQPFPLSKTPWSCAVQGSMTAQPTGWVQSLRTFVFRSPGP